MGNLVTPIILSIFEISGDFNRFWRKFAKFREKSIKTARKMTKLTEICNVLQDNHFSKFSKAPVSMKDRNLDIIFPISLFPKSLKFGGIKGKFVQCLTKKSAV